MKEMNDAAEPGGVDVLVVGAGMSGMAAAADLMRAGKRVQVVEKGRGVGGRMATRRIGDAVIDHGAQFVTTRGERFRGMMDGWVAAGVAAEWCRGFAERADGHSRWCGRGGMKSLPRQFAGGVAVALQTHVESISEKCGRWAVALRDGRVLDCGAVVMTAPVPQALAILDAGGVAMRPELRAAMDAIDYERSLTVLAVLNGPSGLREPGGMAFEEGPIGWLADNQMKGISPVPCLTIQASHAFSMAHWDGDREAAGRELLDAAQPWVAAGVREFQIHGWRYAKPVRVHDEACAVVSAHPPLVLAGDAFAGPKVEGAARSGWAAAEFLLRKKNA